MNHKIVTITATSETVLIESVGIGNANVSFFIGLDLQDKYKIFVKKVEDIL